MVANLHTLPAPKHTKILVYLIFCENWDKLKLTNLSPSRFTQEKIILSLTKSNFKLKPGINV